MTRPRRVPVRAIAWCALAALPLHPAAAQDADLILQNGRFWTGDSTRASATAVAIRNGRFLAVGDAASVAPHRAAHTRVIDLGGRFATPGFIDNHTHFNQAGALLLGVNLLDVAEPRAFAARVRGARERLPDGAWITGGDWGAYEDWAASSTGDRRPTRGTGDRFFPDRAVIDSVTPATPALLNRWDRSAWLANGAALAAARLDCAQPVEGLECSNGRATGRVTSEALRRVRVYARPTLDKWDALSFVGIPHGFGDEFLRIGGLKGFVDGIQGNSTARFYEPQRHSGERGTWRDSTNTAATRGPGSGMQPEGNMLRNLRGADLAGLWPQVHAIGDEAIDTLLTLYETVMTENPARERRYRIIHSQVLRGAQVAERYAKLGVIAEVQPYHAIDDMRWMEERIGGRSRWAYAFRTLHDAGVRLTFGSDWPGTNASWYTANPMQILYAAVTRRTLQGDPPGGWFPEERLDLETSLRAYTVQNAWAAGEEDEKGRIAPRLLADVVVLEQDLFAISPERIKDVKALLTVVGGRVVHAAAPFTR
jgi:predicted amidohydrolase YtcJ